jgi:putative tryptophan/tyrosine transport system substrate-binding protein
MEESIEADMKKRTTILALGALLFALCLPVSAQQPAQTVRLGALLASSASAEKSRIEAFRQGLRDLGYIEGKNIVIEWRYADLKLDRLLDLASELVRLRVNIIVTGGSTSTRAAKQVTSTIPIVMGQSNDPVGEGFVASLARPGGNITGLSTLAPEISGKQLELLKDSVPRLSHVAVYKQSTNQAHAPMLKEIELAAGVLKVQLQYLDVLSAKDIDSAFQKARTGRADAILVLSSPLVVSQRTQITELAAKSRLPVMYPIPEAVEAGGLMSYGASWPDLFRRAATYVDKILKGRTPAELPVEQPIKFELVINLKAAKQIGLTIPPNVLARADRVIK